MLQYILLNRKEIDFVNYVYLWRARIENVAPILRLISYTPKIMTKIYACKHCRPILF